MLAFSRHFLTRRIIFPKCYAESRHDGATIIWFISAPTSRFHTARLFAICLHALHNAKFADIV